VFIADAYNYRVRKVTESTGIIETIAGDGTAGYSGDNGPATSATFAFPSSVAVDSSGKRTNLSRYIVSVTNYCYLHSLGNVYIGDSDNLCVRKLTVSTGILTTVAGTGTRGGYSGDGGQATAAELGAAFIALDSSGG
jgi:hypothetical protein